MAITPYLYYEDAGNALKFLAKAFGFRRSGAQTKGADAGATIIEELTDTSYGHRRYTATDPEGHEWCFAEPIRRAKAARKATAASSARASARR
ncbi:MAG: hypothetical protein HYU53_10995 [Acidobacteria bacterium]|nr:hypothetical protein [Acidobacteriota bacterium]